MILSVGYVRSLTLLRKLCWFVDGDWDGDLEPGCVDRSLGLKRTRSYTLWRGPLEDAKVALLSGSEGAGPPGAGAAA